MRYQYYAISDISDVEGYADSIYDAKQEIRKRLKGKFSWKDDVTIFEVKE